MSLSIHPFARRYKQAVQLLLEFGNARLKHSIKANLASRPPLLQQQMALLLLAEQPTLTRNQFILYLIPIADVSTRQYLIMVTVSAIWY